MELIDKRGKINKVTFKQIIAASGEIICKSKTFEIKTDSNNLLLDLFTQDVQNDASIDISIIAGDKEYIFTGKDFNWFLKIDRLSDLSKYLYDVDLFGSAEEPAEPKTIASIKPAKLLDMLTYYVATASMKDPDNPIVNDFSGLKQDCIKWLNQQIVQNANLNNEVEMLICLDYQSENPEWKTLKELFDEGKIDIC